MKIAVFLFVLAAVSAAVYALDLDSAARRERERRESLKVRRSGPAPSFTNDDLARYERDRDRTEPVPVRKGAMKPSARESNPAKEREFWEREARRHERELARLDAGIRRLEWRLREKQSRRPAGERFSKDPVVEVLEDSLETLREERKRIDERFRERARRAGALPGWLR